MDLPDWLARFAAAAYRETYKATLPKRLADALTPDALAAWLASVDLADAYDGYRTRAAALADAITRVTLAAVAAGPTALAALAADLPQIANGTDLDGLPARIGPLIAPDRAPLSADAIATMHALWAWACATPQPTGRMAYWFEAYGAGGRAGRQPLDIAGPDIPAADLKHPLAPLVYAWLEAHRTAARHVPGRTGVAARQLTRWRRGEAPLFVPTADAVIVPPDAAAVQGTLPGMAPSAWPADTVIYSFWHAMIEQVIERSLDNGRSPKRARPDGLRAVRAALYIADRPHVRRRRGRVPVDVDLRHLARHLWPGDARPGRAGTEAQRFRAQDRTLDAMGLFRFGVDGGLLFPFQRAAWTPPDVLARGQQRFTMHYGERGGNGAAYDRWLMREAGADPRRFLAYLAYVCAVDRSGRVDLDAFADAVHLGLKPGRRRQRRAETLAALAWLADWRPPLLGPDNRPVLDRTGNPRADRTAPPRVVYRQVTAFGAPNALVLQRPPALPADDDAGAGDP